MNLEPIKNGEIAPTIVQRITDAIIRGDIKPGDQMPTEMELMSTFNVGRNSIREAIKMLSAMGILEIRRGQGTFITTKISVDVFNPLLLSLIIEPGTSYDLYELRFIFEVGALNLAIDKASDKDLDLIEDTLRDMETLINKETKDIDEIVEADMKFHIQILKSTHNPLIERIGKVIIELFKTYTKETHCTDSGSRIALSHHKKIYETIKQRNKANAYKVVEFSLSEWKNTLK